MLDKKYDWIENNILIKSEASRLLAIISLANLTAKNRNVVIPLLLQQILRIKNKSQK